MLCSEVVARELLAPIPRNMDYSAGPWLIAVPDSSIANVLQCYLAHLRSGFMHCQGSAFQRWQFIVVVTNNYPAVPGPGPSAEAAGVGPAATAGQGGGNADTAAAAPSAGEADAEVGGGVGGGAGGAGGGGTSGAIVAAGSAG